MVEILLLAHHHWEQLIRALGLMATAGFSTRSPRGKLVEVLLMRCCLFGVRNEEMTYF